MCSEDNKWHYLKVNKGRYLCSKHGGFCDSSDSYIGACPLCDKNDDDKHWQINHVDTALQIVRNLQARSMKRFYIIYGVTGFLGLLSVFPEFDIADYLSNLCWLSKAVLVLFGGCFFLSFIFYLASMAHVKVTYRDKTCGFFGTAKFLKKTTKCWEKYIVCYLHAFEICHKAGNLALCFSMGFLVTFLIIQLLSS